MKIFILFLFISFQLHSNECKIVYTDRPPSYIVDVKKSTRDSFVIGNTVQAVTKKKNDKTKLLTELVFNDQFKHNSKLIKKDTLVRAMKQEKFSEDTAEHLIQVEVLSVKNSNLNKVLEAKTNFEVLKNTEKGFLSSKSLKRVESSDYLILKEDSKLFGLDNFDIKSLKEGQAISAVESKGTYKVNQCKNEDGSFDYYYLYNIIDLNNNKAGLVQLHYSNLQCTGLTHIDKQDFATITELTSLIHDLYNKDIKVNQLQFNEWGLVRLPAITTNPNSKNIVAKAHDESFVIYKGNDPLHSDTWGNPSTICQFMTVASKWKVACQKLGYTKKQCQIQTGDISWMTPGIKDNGIDPLGHRHHSKGNCIDIRPMRKDNLHQATSINQTAYNSNLTQELIRFLGQNNATPIYFNDPKIHTKDKGCDLDNPENDRDKGVLSCPGHGNHIHFCFEKKSSTSC